MNKTYYIDVSVLRDKFYTGIPKVNYVLAKYFRKHYPDNTFFFIKNEIVKPEFVDLIIEAKTGIFFNNVNYNPFDNNSLKAVLKNDKNKSIAIFSARKKLPYGIRFDFEVQIFHDLTMEITKECHEENAARELLKKMKNEVKNNDLMVCVSESSQEDLVNYFGFDRKKTMVSYVGCDDEIGKIAKYDEFLEKNIPEKFVLVLGTIEPRKNVVIVFEYLEKNPQILEDYKFVFIGKDGWGKSFKTLLYSYKIKDFSKILHFGFVSDNVRNIFLKTASFVIYPSVYEGFGSPVLESLAAGTPVLTTFTSSIPEVAENVGYYCDPYSLQSFENAINKILYDLNNTPTEIKIKCREQAAKFSWDSFIEKFIYKIDKSI